MLVDYHFAPLIWFHLLYFVVIITILVTFQSEHKASCVPLYILDWLSC